MQKVDFLIVGQGLAGTVLSQQLINNGFSVKVFDSKKENSASRIAAGVYNPVAYRKLKKAEFAEFLIPEMSAYYQELQSDLRAEFFQSMSFLKLLTDFEEFNNWQIQNAIPKNSPFMSKDIVKSDFDGSIDNPYGAGQVLQSGLVQLPILLDAWKKRLDSLGCLVSDQFVYSKLEILESGFKYEDYVSKRVIFSEGIGLSLNPWFNWLPLQKFKGEVLEIYAPALKADRMINRGVFLLPIGNGYFKVGATHDWRNVDELPTEEGKLELTEKLEKFLNVPYTVVKHKAGLRPAARDRRPYIGVHPKIENMFVFNGLGSKGVIMTPWLVKKFIEGLEEKNWPKEFDIKRFNRFYNEKENNDEKN